MDLKDYRDRIDAVDDEIVRLFRRRMEIVEELGRYKRTHALPFEDLRRETAVLERLAEQFPESFKPSLMRLYETFFSISKDYMSRSLTDNNPNLNISIMAKYVCDLCGYEYDPAKGDPDAGIPAGTSFENLPADWVCPLCGAGKGDFSAA